MKKTNFVHLYVQSDYELGASLSRIREDIWRPGELIRKAKEFGMPALAITDSNLSGAVEFYEACGEVSIKPIIGGIITIKFAGDLEINIVLLAKNEGGYANLVRLINLFHLEKIELDVLTKNSNGLICLLDLMYIRRDCRFGGALLKLNEAEKIVRCLKRIYKDNLFLCIGRHNFYIEEEINEMIIKLSKKFSVPLVAVNYCHYVDKEDALAQTVHLFPYYKLAKNKLLVLRAFNSGGIIDFSLKSPQEMKNLLSDLPESISNTIKISKMCNLKLPLYEKVHLPDFLLPPELNAKEYLKKLCYQGAIKRYGKVSEDINKRLNKELKMIFGMKLENYFLILHDMVQYARRENIIIGPGRGSATRSLVNYLLRITGLDPIRYGLYFERFLNPQKDALPDLDIDCAASGRPKVLDYIRQKYGKENIVQVASFGRKFARGSIREVGKFLNRNPKLKFPSQKVERIARMIPLGRTIENTLAYDSKLRELYRKDEISRKILNLSRKLEGVKTCIQAHATAVVPKPNDRNLPIPLTQTKDGKIITQYDSETLLKLGYFKIDILALNVLDTIQQTLKIIEQKTGKKIELEDISVNDKKTYKLLSNAQTTGVFHFDSKGWKKLLKKLKPENLLHLTALIGLYRPGLIESGLLDEFIKRKKVQIKITYKYPLLEPILKETYGLILYQEQVMKIVMELAGFSPVQANTFRQAMGKKIPRELEEQKTLFLQGIKKNDISESKGEEIFNQLERQGGWGLSKAHACPYALIAYWTAYLKANYPEEYMRALIKSLKHDSEEKKEYLAELKRIQKLKAL